MAKRPVTSRPRGRLFVGCDAQRWAQVSGAQGLNVSNAPMALGWPGMREKMARPGEGAGTWGGTGPEGRQSCSILLFDSELSFDISKQKMTWQGSQSPGRDEHGEVQAALYSHPAHKKRSPGRPLCRLQLRCGSGQGIGPEGVARICVPRVSIDQGNASGRKLARICGTRGEGSKPFSSPSTGWSRGWSRIGVRSPASSCLVAWPIW